MWKFGKSLWDTIVSAISAERGFPYVSTILRLPIRTKTYKPMTPSNRWQYIVIHHSFTQDDATTRNWDAIRKYHIEVNGWKDIGYHFGIEQVDGQLTVLEGRPLDIDGAHALGFNRNGIGICLVGNYDIDAPDERRMELLHGLVSQLMGENEIHAWNVIGHRETYQLRGVKVEKTCPGSQFDMVEFRNSLTDNKGNT